MLTVATVAEEGFHQRIHFSGCATGDKVGDFVVRDRRVAELLRSEIADVLLREIKDPKVKDVVITGIEISKDLSIAKVFFSTYNRAAKEGIEMGLNRSAGFIRHCIIKGLTIKKVPNLRFIYDESSDYGQKIDAVLRNISSTGE